MALALLAPTCLRAAPGPRDFDGAWRAVSQASTASPGVVHGCAPAFVAGVGAASTAHIVMGRDVMVIVHEANHSVRRIHLNGQHPANLQPSISGHSIGWWEGDTLVVETAALRSGQTVVERMRKVNNGRALEVLVNGRAMLAEPRPGLRYIEEVCEPDARADAATAAGTADVSGAASLASPVATAPVATATAEPASTRPDFDGAWQISQPVRMLRPPDGSWPPLRSETRKLYEQRIDLFKSGRAVEFNGSNACVPPGEPRTAHGGQAFDIVQGAHALFIGYTWNRMLRMVYLEAGNDADARPAWYGHWTGRWDGDVLVMEGTGFRADYVLDAAGLPHSDALHLTQRLGLVKGGNEIEMRTTIDDPKSYTRSWSTVQRFHRQKDAVVQEHVCVPLKE